MRVAARPSPIDAREFPANANRTCGFERPRVRPGALPPASTRPVRGRSTRDEDSIAGLPHAHRLNFADAQDRHPRPHPAAGLAEPRRKVRRRPLPGDGPHRGPPPHLQGRQVLPRGLGQRVRPGSAHRRLREVRRRRAGRLDRAGAVLVLGQAEPGARAAPSSQRSHGRHLPRSIHATTPASARCRCSRRRSRSRKWSAASRSSAFRACRSARTAKAGISTRRSSSRSSRPPPISAPRSSCIRGT